MKSKNGEMREYVTLRGGGKKCMEGSKERDHSVELGMDRKTITVVLALFPRLIVTVYLFISLSTFVR
jgi:hypothetical protein